MREILIHMCIHMCKECCGYSSAGILSMVCTGMICLPDPLSVILLIMHKTIHMCIHKCKAVNGICPDYSRQRPWPEKLGN